MAESDLPVPVSKKERGELDAASEEQGLAPDEAPSTIPLFGTVLVAHAVGWTAYLLWVGELRRVLVGYQLPWVFMEFLGLAVGFFLVARTHRDVDRWFMVRSNRIAALFLLPFLGLLLMILTGGSGPYHATERFIGWGIFCCLQTALGLVYARLVVVGLGRFGGRDFRRFLGFLIFAGWCGLAGWMMGDFGRFSPFWATPVSLLGVPLNPFLGVLGLAVTGAADPEALRTLEAEDAGILGLPPGDSS